MNRGDARLFLTIIATAFVTVVLTLIVSRLVATHDARDARSEAELRKQLVELDGRILLLEQRITLLEHPAPVVLPEAPDPSPCDEVACVLNNYESKCCAKFKQPHPTPHDDGIPDNLDREMISAGVGAVKLDVLACAGTDVSGQVKVRVKVAPSGIPSEVDVKLSPTPDLGACVARVMKTARFPKTTYGGSFSYPFVF